MGKDRCIKLTGPHNLFSDFTDKRVTEIGGFFVCGIEQKVETLTDAFKICKG